MTNRTHPLARAVLIGAGTLAASVAVGAAVAAHGGPSSANAHAPVAQLRVAGTPLAAVAPRIAALRRPRTTSDATRAARMRGLPVARHDVIDLRTAKPIAGHRIPALLASGDAGRDLCLVAAGLANCTKPESLARTGFSPSVTWDASGTVTISGIAVDEVRNVDVISTGGNREAIPVEDNVILAHRAELPSSIRWTSPAGAAQEFPVTPPPVPLAHAGR